MELVFLKDEETARKWKNKDPGLIETFNVPEAVEFGASFFMPLLEDVGNFLPEAVAKTQLPESVPEAIVKEFREAEKDAAYASYRSASAMLRAVLEKTLTKNGYDEVEHANHNGIKMKSNALLHRIDAAADNGLITEAIRRRAHENVRILGDDVMHDEWREITKEEFEEARDYSQRILEEFYGSMVGG